MADLKSLSDDDLRGLLSDVLAEKDRRRAAPAVEAGKAEVVQSLRESGVVEGPPHADEVPADAAAVPAWRDPGQDHSMMYLYGDVVSHGGRVWRSEVQGLNHWEPGGVGVYGNIWSDCTSPPPVEEDEDGNPVAQPYTDSRQYQAGEVVDYQGELYTCQQDHYAAPGWTPLNAHSMWKRNE